MKCQCFLFTRAAVICSLSLGLGACSHQSHSTPTPNPIVDSGPRMTPEKGQTLLEDNAKAQREIWKDKTFEDFKAQTFKEPFEGGKYIVNGDTPRSLIPHPHINSLSLDFFREEDPSLPL